MTSQYSYSSNHEVLSDALKSFWMPYSELVKEVDNFAPLSLLEMDKKHRVSLSDHFLSLNPNHTEESLKSIVDNQLQSITKPDWQFFSKFHTRIMTMYVSVTLLSLALCEAEINVVLATGLYENNQSELFSAIQKADIKEKWIAGPKCFCSTYELKKNSALYETLRHLNSQRNVWVHHKPFLHANDRTVIEGSRLPNHTYQDLMYWMGRFFSLPYDLASHGHKFTHSAVLAMMDFTRSPIPIAEAHLNNHLKN
jgi:hypothetical protein